MSIATTTRTAGPFTGTGLVSSYPFAFKVFADTDLVVVVTSGTVDTTLVLTTDYTVTLNADQNTNAGGTVDLVTPLANGDTLLTSSAVPYLQPVDITNQSGFYPSVINNALDRLTILAQQSVVDSEAYADAQDVLVKAYTDTQVATSRAITSVAGYPYVLSDFASFDEALTLIGAAVTTLLVNENVTIAADTVVPATLTLEVINGEFSIDTGKTLTIYGPFQCNLAQCFSGDGTVIFGVNATKEILPSWWGAKGDNSNDDTAALQSAVTAMPANGGRVFIPAGIYKITTPISVPSGHNRGLIYGAGDSTKIAAVGCAAFLFAGQGYYGFTLERMWLYGNSTVSIPAIDCSPSTVSYVVTAHFRYLQISGFVIGWKLKNAQLCHFADCNADMNANGVVFSIIPDSGSGQQCNANRVYRMRITGANVATITCTLPTATERATNWLFDSCDFQQSGASTTPLTIVDTYYKVINCEFENYTGSNLIELRSDNSLTANYSVIQGNILQGGGAAGAGKIYINRTGSQWTYHVTIMNNDAGSSTTNLCDCTGRAIIFIANQGTVNDTNPQYNIQIGGNSAGGETQGVNVSSRYIHGVTAIIYNGTMALDASLGNEFEINVTGGSALTLSSPTKGIKGQRITVRFKNTSGGAMGVVTWGALYKMATFTNPATGYSRSVDFTFDGSNWIEISRTANDIPN